jgi:hypothetical protein
VKQLLEQCIDDLKRGDLTEEKLRTVIAAVGAPEAKRQDLLYLQAARTSVTAPVNGMLLVQGGVVQEGGDDAAQWPYQTVLDAMQDGWRVISFPNLALMLAESQTYGLGCEFILERWRWRD